MQFRAKRYGRHPRAVSQYLKALGVGPVLTAPNPSAMLIAALVPPIPTAMLAATLATALAATLTAPTPAAASPPATEQVRAATAPPASDQTAPGATRLNAPDAAARDAAAWDAAAPDAAARDAVAPRGNEPPPDLKFERYTRLDGLPTVPIGPIIQDDDGLLWMTTWNGLYRFDGLEFKGYFHDPDDSTTVSADWVTGPLLDSRGRMWFGTIGGGLNRFDRDTERFTAFVHDPGDPNSLSGDAIGVLVEAADGSIWVATDRGLDRLDPDSGQFTRFQWEPGDPRTLAGHQIRAIYEESPESVWVGTGNPFVGGEPGALNRLNPRTGVVERYPLMPANPMSPRNFIETILPDPGGFLWVTTWEGGLYRFDPASGAYSDVVVPLAPYATESAYFGATSLKRGADADILWMSVFRGGIIRYNTRSGRVTQYRQDPDDPFSLPDPRVWHVTIDAENMLWAATHTGLVRADLAGRLDRVRLPPGLEDEWVNDIALAGERDVWFGTTNDRLVHWDGVRLRTVPLPRSPCTNFNVTGTAVTVGDSGGLYTLGRCGLFSFDPDQDFFRRIRLEIDPSRIAGDHPMRIRVDSGGLLWIASEPEAIRFDPDTGDTARYGDLPDSTRRLTHADLEFLTLDSRGDIWIGAADGLNRLETGQRGASADSRRPDTGPLAREAAEPRVHRFTFSEIYQTPGVTGLAEAHDGTLWVSTDQLGLMQIERDGTILRTVSVRDGLDVSSYLDVAVAPNGSVWGRSVNGLSVFDPVGGGISNFSATDGLVPAQFGVHAIAVMPDGRILVGGEGGFNVIDPRERLPSIRAPRTILTELRVNGEVQRAEPHGILTTRLADAAAIRLPHDGNDIQVSYTSPAFRTPELVGYQVRLDPVDADWLPNGSNRNIRYTNLDPGSYTLHIRARTGLGQWSERPAELAIEVRPPWWQSIWAYLVYAGLMLAAARVSIRKLRLRAIREEQERARRQELEQAHALREAYDELERTHRELKETQARVAELKSRFFANISHEFRTPLTLILGQIESLMAARREAAGTRRPATGTRRETPGTGRETPGTEPGDGEDPAIAAAGTEPRSQSPPSTASSELERLETVRRNGNRLLRLINQLLDLSRMEAGAMTLAARPGDLTAFVRDLSTPFEPAAASRGITWSLVAGNETHTVPFDADKLEKVFFNLFSNALKFTPSGGRVDIRIRNARLDGDTAVAVDVADTGPGIPPELHDRIFDRFFQVASGHRSVSEGTGIGLALTKELVDLHHGRVSFESEPGRGSTFTVLLRSDDTAFDSDELVDAAARTSSQPMASRPVLEDLLKDRDEFSSPRPETAPDNGLDHMNDQGVPIVLIVEDNEELRRFVAGELAGAYIVEEAATGLEGLERARDLIPDLIISDVMMPELDGFGMLERLRSDERTSHIPVVMLTARAAFEDRMEGFGRGADAYLVKPFSSDELRLRVGKLIEMREMLRSRFSTATVIRPGEIEATDIDQAFLARVLDVIEDRLADAAFSVEELGGEVGMSVSQLNRKLNALVDQPAGRLIRSMRLQRAADLLSQNAGSVSEIADMVGFSSQSSLATAFKRRFGATPTEYRDAAGDGRP